MFYFIDIKYSKGDLVIKSMNNYENIRERLRNYEKADLDYVELDFSPKNGKKNDFLLSQSIILPFVSKKVKHIIENQKKCMVQFFPTNIPDYYLMHTIGTIKAFDWANSVYTENPSFIPELADKPNKVEALSLDENKIDKDLFRMYEEPITLFISKKLKTTFEEHKITGIEYKPLEDYRKGVLL
jgi:hypothetical protein